MRTLGVLRAVASWAVGGYLLAIAAFGPVMALYALTGGATGLVVVAISGPVALLVLTPYAASRIVTALSKAEAVPDTELTRRAGAVFDRDGLPRPVAWSAPGLHDSAAVTVRGLRRFTVALPAPSGAGAGEASATALRRALDGTSMVLPLHVATAAALSQWIGAVRFFIAPWADREMDGYYRARMFWLPVFTPLPALGALVAWSAVLLSTLLVGPRAAGDLVAAAGTAEGPLERTRRVYDSRVSLFRWSRTLASQGDDVVEATGTAPVLDGRRVGLLRLPTAVAATQAGFSVPAFAAVDIVLGILLWQPAVLVTGTSNPAAPLVTTAVFLLPLLVVTVTLTRVVTGHSVLLGAERDVRAEAFGEAVTGASAAAGSAGSGPKVRDVVGMWPYWILVVVGSGGLAWLVALAAGLVGRISGHTDEVRAATAAVVFPVVLAVAVLWTLHAVFRRGDPLGLVQHSRRTRGLSTDRGRGSV
ncbi:hypothetical protein ABEG17_01205 [Pedococcus sp. KACC 23699]|uniref:Uncharacterized protein n=1 Tax=Pedococcus sp. KACC 23699 TaxID=3149228 RepID=A0AAU7JUP9_9MICO